MFARRFWPGVCLLAGLCLASACNAEMDQGQGEDQLSPPTDAEIFAVTDQFNTLDIEIGRVGAERGRSEEVRALGKTVASDQEAMQIKGRELGRKLKIFAKPPRNELGSYAETVAKLQAKSESEFDSAYLKQEIVFERNVINALTQMLPSITEAELAKFMGEVVRKFEQHLAAMKAVAKNLALE